MAKIKEAVVKIQVDNKDLEELVKTKKLLARLVKDNNIELPEEDKSAVSVNWNELVRKEGKIEINGNDYITLAELRRLARLRGYISSIPNVVQAPVYDNHRQATVQWEIVWCDGTIDGAAADASWRTCNPGFRNFTVAIASNRAEARCIRSALGIDTCSYEEIGPEDEDLSGPASDQQKAAITMLLGRNNITISKVPDIFGPEIATRIIDGEKINVSTLSHQDAVKMMAALNKIKPAKGE